VREGPAHQDGKLVGEGWLEGRQPVLRHADQRRVGGLMLPTLRRQRQARRRRDEQGKRASW
jgi:hypothetical protein